METATTDPDGDLDLKARIVHLFCLSKVFSAISTRSPGKDMSFVFGKRKTHPSQFEVGESSLTSVTSWRSEIDRHFLSSDLLPVLRVKHTPSIADYCASRWSSN